jgi:hypothetical protein
LPFAVERQSIDLSPDALLGEESPRRAEIVVAHGLDRVVEVIEGEELALACWI